MEFVGGAISETAGDINANVVCKGDEDFGCVVVSGAIHAADEPIAGEQMARSDRRSDGGRFNSGPARA